jgi:uncharacterized cupin superfamily protein
VCAARFGKANLMPKIDPSQAPSAHGTGYPDPYAEPCLSRQRWRLGDAAGLTDFGANLLRLPAGAWSSQRHWHTAEDEFICVLSGEVVLIEDEAETVLKPGDFAGFKAGVGNGHHLVNRSGADAVILEIGSRWPDRDAVDYPDIDLKAQPGEGYLHRDGTPHPDTGRRYRP